MLELQIAQVFLQRVIDESTGLVKGSADWWQSSFGKYLYLHGAETLEIFEIEEPNNQQFFYTSPRVTAENRDQIRSPEQKRDSDLCGGFRYIFQYMLPASDMVEATYVGFESNSFCN